MKIGEQVEIRRGPFASYHARVVALHSDGSFDGAVLMFGHEGVVRFAPTDLQEEASHADNQTLAQRVRAEYDLLRKGGVPHDDAVVEASIDCGVELYNTVTETVTAPSWAWQVCANRN